MENFINSSLATRSLPYYSNRIDDLIFSLDGNRLLIKGQVSDVIRFPVHIVNSDGTDFKELGGTWVSCFFLWINNNKITYFDVEGSKKFIAIFDCVSEETKTIELRTVDKTLSFFIRDMQTTVDNKLIFTYMEVRIPECDSPYASLGIGTFADSPQPEINYKDLFISSSEQKEIRKTTFDSLTNGRIIFNSDKKEFFFLLKPSSLDDFTDSILPNLTKNEEVVPVRQEGLDKKSSPRSVSLRGDKIAVAVEENNLVIYCIDTNHTIKSMVPNEILSLKFSKDGTMLMVACRNELVILSALTGEKIDSFTYADGQAFSVNTAIDLSPDGGNLALGGDYSQFNMLAKELNVMIWKLVSDQYLETLNKLEKISPSIHQVVLLALLHARAKRSEKPMTFTKADKDTFQLFDDSVQQMLTDIGYVAPGQQSQPAEELAPGEEVHTVGSSQGGLSTEPGSVKPEQQSEDLWQKLKNARISAQSWLDYFSKKLSGLPGFG